MRGTVLSTLCCLHAISRSPEHLRVVFAANMSMCKYIAAIVAGRPVHVVDAQSPAASACQLWHNDVPMLRAATALLCNLVVSDKSHMGVITHADTHLPVQTVLARQWTHPSVRSTAQAQRCAGATQLSLDVRQFGRQLDDGREEMCVCGSV